MAVPELRGGADRQEMLVSLRAHALACTSAWVDPSSILTFLL